MGKAEGNVRRIGLLIPSSNTVVEPEALRLLPSDEPVTLHSSRLRVTSISSEAASLDQFDAGGMLAAAMLLADACVDCIAWAGTSASWLGQARDEAFVRAVEDASGIRATTALLAINRRLGDLGAARIGLVTPYIRDLEDRIIANYAAAGITVSAAQRLDLTVNTDYADVSEATVAAMVHKVSAARPDAIVIMCTNLRFGVASRQVSAELGLPVLDSVAVTIEDCLSGPAPAWRMF